MVGRRGTGLRERRHGRNEDELELLRQQYDLAATEIRNLSRIIHGALGLAVPILITAAGYSYSQEKELKTLVVLLPFLLGSVILYALQALNAVETLAGHKRWIERRVNRLVGRRVMFYEQVSGATIVLRTAQMISASVLVLFFLASMGAALFVAYGAWAREGVWWVTGGIVGLIVAVFVSAWATFSKSRKAALELSEHFASMPPEERAGELR